MKKVKWNTLVLMKKILDAWFMVELLSFMEEKTSINFISYGE